MSSILDTEGNYYVLKHTAVNSVSLATYSLYIKSCALTFVHVYMYMLLRIYMYQYTYKCSLDYTSISFGLHTGIRGALKSHTEALQWKPYLYVHYGMYI